MPVSDRAAQFIPFMALTGYEDAVEETARLTDRKIDLDETQKNLLDDLLRRASESGETVAVLYFQPDKRKAGGAYSMKTGTVSYTHLGAGYTAYIYKDSDDPTMMATDVQAVDSSSVLMLDLASTGGCAILFTNENFLQELQDDASYVYYEAESSQNSLTGQASVVQDGNCFGEKKVGNLGGSASSSVTFENVTAASAGSYEVKLYYASGDQRNISLWVNNGEERVLELPATGSYHTLRCQRFYVELDAGVNQLRFGGTSYAPDVDRIAVRAAEPQYYTKMEAEDGIITSPAYAQNSSGFSGEKKVSYVGYAGEVTLNNVHVEQSLSLIHI